jgi:sulfite exporter TauE/SafE
MTIPFIIGLLSALHCFGMCGGIVGALTMSLAPEIRARQGQLFFYSLAYNLGRLTSYTIAGILIGLLGSVLVELLAPQHGIPILRILAAVIIILLGLYLGGWLPRLALVENLGTPIWKKLQPVGQRLLPVKNPFQAFMFGAVWGWLPCGLVYYALLLALSEGNTVDAGLFMFMFGLGTLIPMLIASMLTGRMNSIRNSRIISRLSGGLLILMGLLSLVLLYNPEFLHSLHFMPQKVHLHEIGH